MPGTSPRRGGGSRLASFSSPMPSSSGLLPEVPIPRLRLNCFDPAVMDPRPGRSWPTLRASRPKRPNSPYQRASPIQAASPVRPAMVRRHVWRRAPEGLRMQSSTGSIPPTAIPQLSRKIPRKFQRPLTWASMKVDASRMGTTQVYRSQRSGTCIRRLESSTSVRPWNGRTS